MVIKDRRDVSQLGGLVTGAMGTKRAFQAVGSAYSRAQRLDFWERSTDRGVREMS